MFVFHIPREMPDEHFVYEERQIILKGYGPTYLRLRRFLWDYVEIAAEAQSTTIPDCLESMLTRSIEAELSGPAFVNPIIVNLVVATVAVDRATYNFANDDGEGDTVPTMTWQLPTLERYQRGMAISTRARALLRCNLEPMVGARRAAVILPDLHAKRYTQVKRIRARHRNAKPKLLPE